jgi:hypothetical protein
MKRKGQGFLEYAVLIGCIVITLFAMQTYLKRGIQGIIKSTSDDLGSPVLEATGRNAQVEGAISAGRDVVFKPTTIAANQEIITNEHASGDRRFVINQDRREIDSGVTVTIPVQEYLNYGKDNTQPASSVQTNSAQAVSTGDVTSQKK